MATLGNTDMTDLFHPLDSTPPSSSILPATSSFQNPLFADTWQTSLRNPQGQRQPTARAFKTQSEPLRAEYNINPSPQWLKGTSLSLKGGMLKVMNSGEYSDLTILCDNQKFSAHKVVVCSQSKVLAAAMKKGFKESEINTIDLSGDGIVLVSNLVTFLYTGNYPEMADTSYVEELPMINNEDSRSPAYPGAFPRSMDSLVAPVVSGMEHGGSSNTGPSTSSRADPKVASATHSPDYSLHVEMYALSDQYDIPALGSLAKARFDGICTLDWNPQSFLEVIPRVYESTLDSNQGLRTVVIHHACRHSNEIMGDGQLRASFHALSVTIPELAWALLNEYMSVRSSLYEEPIFEGLGEDIGPIEFRYRTERVERHGGLF